MALAVRLLSCLFSSGLSAGREERGTLGEEGGGKQRGHAGRFNATQKPAEITREGGPRDKVRVRATLFPWSQTPRRCRVLVHT